jgi:hypothetical protein
MTFDHKFARSFAVPAHAARMSFAPRHRFAPRHPSVARRPLPPDLRQPIEAGLGKDLSGVGFAVSERPSLFGADGLAQGTLVEVSPAVAAGSRQRLLRLVAHEVKHVDQQQERRAARGPGPSAVLAAPSLEAEAERFADQVGRGAVASEIGAEREALASAARPDLTAEMNDKGSPTVGMAQTAVVPAAPIQLGNGDGDGHHGEEEQKRYKQYLLSKGLSKTAIWSLATGFGATEMITLAKKLPWINSSLFNLLRTPAVQKYGAVREILGLPFDVFGFYQGTKGLMKSGHDYDFTSALAGLTGVLSGLFAGGELIAERRGKMHLAHKLGSIGGTSGIMSTLLMPMLYYQLYRAGSRGAHGEHDRPGTSPIMPLLRDVTLYATGMGSIYRPLQWLYPQAFKDPHVMKAMTFRSLLGVPLLAMMFGQNIREGGGRDVDAALQLAASTGIFGLLAPFLSQMATKQGFTGFGKSMFEAGAVSSRSAAAMMIAYLMLQGRNIRDFYDPPAARAERKRARHRALYERDRARYLREQHELRRLAWIGPEKNE